MSDPNERDLTRSAGYQPGPGISANDKMYRDLRMGHMESCPRRKGSAIYPDMRVCTCKRQEEQ